MTMITRLAAAAFVAAAVFAAGPGAAATCSTANLTTSTACQPDIPGGPGGNVRDQEMNGFNAGTGVFGVNAWQDLGKVETDGALASTYFSITKTGDDSAGTWALKPEFKFAAGESYAFVLKGGKDNVAYLLDTAFASGTWTNLDLFTPNGRNNAGLSNMTFFGTATPAPVPLPAAAWLLLGGMAGLAAVSRRRKATRA